MSDADTLARHEAKTEPPKRWRNRYRTYRGVWTGCKRCNGLHLANSDGTECFGCAVHPSREIAEHYALSTIVPFLESHQEWLGAEPAP